MEEPTFVPVVKKHKFHSGMIPWKKGQSGNPKGRQSGLDKLIAVFPKSKYGSVEAFLLHCLNEAKTHTRMRMKILDKLVPDLAHHTGDSPISIRVISGHANQLIQVSRAVQPSEEKSNEGANGSLSVNGN
jgi:hypothetical protein